MDREKIYSALFTRLQQSVRGSPSNARTVERRLREIEDIPPEQMPYVGQVQMDEVVRCDIPGVVSRHELHVIIYAYVATQKDDANGPAAVLNPVLDAIQQVFTPDTDSQDPNLSNCTLGGLVISAYIEGKISTSQGNLGEKELAVVPVTLLLLDSP